MRVSASMIQLYMSCPLKARFRYKDHLRAQTSSAMSFGTCVHQALEEYNRHGDVDRAIASFEHYWDFPEELGAEVEIWNKRMHHQVYAKMGLDCIRLYDEKCQMEERIIVAQEHPFMVPIGEHMFSGRVDLMEIRRSGRGKNVLRLVDYKTGKQPPYPIDNLKLNIQFTAYDYASRQVEFWSGIPGNPDYPPLAANWEELWEAYKPPFPRRGIWFHLRDGKEYDAGDRDDGDFARMHRCIEEIARAWEHDVFVPCISGDTCYYCDYAEPCGIPITTKREDDEERF